jgi:hypothetical protein
MSATISGEDGGALRAGIQESPQKPVQTRLKAILLAWAVLISKHLAGPSSRRGITRAVNRPSSWLGLQVAPR